MARRQSVSADTKVDVYLPLYVRDFLTSTIGWTAEERGHYLTLLMIQWDRGSLPAEASDLERLSPGVCQCWSVLASKFPVCEDGTRLNAKLEEHRVRCVEIREKRSQAAKSAASGRWSGDASRIANASQTHSKRIANPCHPTSTSTSYARSSTDVEDSQPAAPVVATSDSPRRRKRSQPKDAINWLADDGWQGITDADRSSWATAFPACTLDIELVRASEWLKANPAKAHKSNWRRFLVSWLSRSQDKGGTIRSAGRTPEDVAKKAHLERKAREFSEYRPAPYRTPKESAALAASLKLKEEEP
jgi:uncharacterized protein YdaU (DUF1376 family)